MTFDDLQALVLFRDSNLIVLNKPAGLAVHGGPKTPVHLEAMLDGLRFNLSHPPRLVHRLDRDTAGCLILARHDKAVGRMGRLFSAGAVDKTYWAVVAGGPEADSGRVDLPLLKISSVRDGWRMVADARGQTAATGWRVLGRGGGLCWLECKPETGRTHQIRVHCASGLGGAIVGDPVYGKAGPMLHLQSHAVSIPYWADRPAIQVSAPAPDHMKTALAVCGWNDDSHSAI
ncbi:MAG TPA: RNA pseudouridine synthase [Candidatus Sulfotelmatobacter sp.]|jgi:tRNA pseudouridine32 synthase/23S rRNA pseudouridine746 synthase/23S rRNA pseudouridine1911/1915/1917 synthase|nr:RNA pseudouridine synthase [Candidatus Sulfotelmatobacter sp.]